MPQLPECYTNDKLPISIGGGLVFPEGLQGLNRDFFKPFADFVREQLSSGKTIISIIGGGGRTRALQADAGFLGITDNQDLDEIGIRVTRQNAANVLTFLEKLKINAQEYNFDPDLKPGVIYIRGGTEPGRTTDYAAVQAAAAVGSCVVFNIGAQPGIFEFTEDGFNPDRLLSHISFEEYLRHAQCHHPGINIPFSREAAELARDQDITVVMLGPDMDNFRKCLAGEEFSGTIIASSQYLESLPLS